MDRPDFHSPLTDATGVPLPFDPNKINRAQVLLERGAASERARIVAWLRSGPPQIWANEGEARQIADVIEWLAGDTPEAPDMPSRPALPWERRSGQPDE